jgi:hypothetical protein
VGESGALHVIGRRLTPLLVATTAAATAAAATDAAASPPPLDGHGPVRAWQGMLIQSLDPPPRRARATQVPGDPTAPPGGTQPQPQPQPQPTEPPPTEPPPPPPPRDRRLSNEATITRWAYTAAIAPIYAAPSTRSRRAARLRWYTEDGFPEIYLVLRSHLDSRDREWIQLRIPARPNGQLGWVRREALDEFHITRKLLVVDRRRLRATFYERGRRRWSAPVGVGKAGTPTPPGRFWIRERFKILDRGSGYWPYAFGTANYSSLSDWPGGGVVGIHGPFFEPGMIPGHPSHGCIRLHTGDTAWLGRNLGLGTPLLVV